MRYAETEYNLKIDLGRGNTERVETDSKFTDLHLRGVTSGHQRQDDVG